MKVRDRLAALVEDIHKDLDSCRQLEVDLTEQQKLLTRQEGEALSRVGQAILAHIEAIQQRARQRSEHLEALGLTAGGEGMSALASRLPEPLRQRLTTDWKHLETALACCKALNERNGELLGSHRQALAALTGQPVTPYGRVPD